MDESLFSVLYREIFAKIHKNLKNCVENNKKILCFVVFGLEIPILDVQMKANDDVSM